MSFKLGHTMIIQLTVLREDRADERCAYTVILCINMEARTHTRTPPRIDV